MLRNKIINSKPENSNVLNKLLNNRDISIKNISKRHTDSEKNSQQTSEEFSIEEVRHIKEEVIDVNESSNHDMSEYSDYDNSYIDDKSASEIFFTESINFQAAYTEETASLNEDNDSVPLHDLIHFVCTKCRKTSKNPDYFINKTDLQCSDCQAMLKFKCSRCKLMFRNFDSAVRHAKKICTITELVERQSPLLMLEMKDNVHKCLACGFSSENTIEFRRHIRFAHPKDEASIACSRCSKSYKSRGSMMKHLRLCGREPHIVCVFCGYRTKRREHLRMHMRHKHPDPESCHGGGYDCPKCNKKYKYLMAMKSHLKTCKLQKSQTNNDAEDAQENETEETVEDQNDTE